MPIWRCNTEPAGAQSYQCTARTSSSDKIIKCEITRFYELTDDMTYDVPFSTSIDVDVAFAVSVYDPPATLHKGIPGKTYYGRQIR